MSSHRKVAQTLRGRVSDPRLAALSGSQTKAPGFAGGDAAGQDSRSEGGLGARGARASGSGEGAGGSAVEGTGAAGSGARAKVWWAAARGAGPATGQAAAESAAELYRPGFADHEGHRDEGVCASVQRAGGRGQSGTSDRGGGGDAGGERQEAIGAHVGASENRDGKPAATSHGGQRLFQRGECDGPQAGRH